jgi:hypothetical protein
MRQLMYIGSFYRRAGARFGDLKGPCVCGALQRIEWRHDGAVGSHKIMKNDGWMDYHSFNRVTKSIPAESPPRSDPQH